MSPRLISIAVGPTRCSGRTPSAAAEPLCVLSDLTEEATLSFVFDGPAAATIPVRVLFDDGSSIFSQVTVDASGRGTARIAPGLPAVSTRLRITCAEHELSCAYSTLPLSFLRSTFAETAASQLPLGMNFSFEIATHACAPVGTSPRWILEDEGSLLPLPNVTQQKLPVGTLLCIAGRAKDQSWPLDQPEVTIGTHRYADITLADQYVRPFHARIEHWIDDYYWIYSGDGPVRVNGEDCGRIRLTPDAVIDIGAAKFRFVRDEPPPLATPDISARQNTNRLVLNINFVDPHSRPRWPGGVRIATNHAPYLQDKTALPLPRPARLSIWAKNAPRTPDVVTEHLLDVIEPLFSGHSQGAELTLGNDGIRYIATTTRFSLADFHDWTGLLPKLSMLLRGKLSSPTTPPAA